MVLTIENMNINEPRTKLNNLEKSKWNFTQQRGKFKPISQMHYISYGACEHKARSICALKQNKCSALKSFIT